MNVSTYRTTDTCDGCRVLKIGRFVSLEGVRPRLSGGRDEVVLCEACSHDIETSLENAMRVEDRKAQIEQATKDRAEILRGILLAPYTPGTGS